MTEHESKPANLGVTRLMIGLAQGVALLALREADEAKAWPSTDTWLFTALLLSFGYVMTTALVAVGQLRPTTFIAWLAGSIALVAATAWHGATREVVASDGNPAILFFVLPLIFFVAYHLVAAADADRRPIASYRTYFDIGWKNGIQLALSLAFVGALWLLLLLGAQLFELINVKFVSNLIEREWFIFPVTAVMFALAVHVTDVRVSLINGIRNVSLVLLSWLLPVMAVFAVAFLATLPATGLEPLWATRNAATILILAGGALIALINATYQDGDASAHWLLQVAARIASIALVPLTALAIYSVWLRVQQHGLSPDRVIVMAVLVVGACYAAGYTLAALWPGRWLKPLELTNVITAFIALTLSIAMLTPIADPARLSVEDQLRRLRAGLIAPEKFDFNCLRDEAARYGRDALQMLARDQSSARARQIATLAGAALKRENVPQTLPEVPMKEHLAKIVVRPGNGRLPDSFINQEWPNDVPVTCPRAQPGSGRECVAYLIDFDGDGTNEIVLDTLTNYQVYRLWSDGQWRNDGFLTLGQCGIDTGNLLASGRYRLAPMREIDVDGRRLRVQGCPDMPADRY